MITSVSLVHNIIVVTQLDVLFVFLWSSYSTA